MRKKENLIAVAIVLLSVALRVYLLFKPGYGNDLGSFIRWGQAASKGVWSLFSGNYSAWIDYPPLVPILSGWWLNLVSALGIKNIDLGFKILPTIFEALLTIVTTLVVYKSKVRYRIWLLAAVIISPGLALVSAGWGQMDAMLALMILLGYLLIPRSLYFSTLLLFVALMIKPQAIIAVGIYFLYLFFSRGIKSFALQAAIFVALFLIPTAIFKFVGQTNFLYPYTQSIGNYDNASLNAFNLWWLIFATRSWAVKDTAQVAGVSYRLIGLWLLFIFELPALIYLKAKARQVPQLILTVAYSYLAFFVLPTEIHERYLFPAVALMAIAALLEKKIFWVYLALSATLLLNCFAVLQSVYPQFEFLKFNLLGGNWTRAVALINILALFYLAYWLATKSFKKTERVKLK